MSAAVGGRRTLSDPTGGTVGSASFDIQGWMAGGQLGCNYQVSNFVFGIEGDASWADIKGSSSDPFFGGKTFDAKSDFLADVAGRVGIAWDHGLIYGKGGVAFVHDKYDFVGGLLGANATVAPRIVPAGSSVAASSGPSPPRGPSRRNTCILISAGRTSP